MKLNYVLPFLLLCSFLSCSPWKKIQVEKGNKDDAIMNAIIDFSCSNISNKDDSVFSISIMNIGEDILGVSIIAALNKIPIITENEIDYSYRAFPTKYFEQDGKLFYWTDSTEKTPIYLINKLTRLNRIDTVILRNSYPKWIVDDSQKALDYYFCKGNLKKYKKVYTRIAMGWYDPPRLYCHH